MWNWDQGRLEYFQFDNLKEISKISIYKDLKNIERNILVDETGLPFLPDRPNYKPWRNYGRTFKLAMLCASYNGQAMPTCIARALASNGEVTTDEYFHFLCEATTDPSPALQGWNCFVERRYPLLFAIKYLLAKCALGRNTVKLNEVVFAYQHSGFIGDENQEYFVGLICDVERGDYIFIGDRQAFESIRVISQISYLSISNNDITISLSVEDAGEVFQELCPIEGNPCQEGDAEIFRISELFSCEARRLQLDYANTAVSDIEDAGFSDELTFSEGRKTRKTHLIIERNSKIRSEFFKRNPTAVCHFCNQDTNKSYPWADKILDVHHLLPLCSGAKVSQKGTTFDDLVPLCPTCHRGVHRYYDNWLRQRGRKDFRDADEAKMVYEQAKSRFKVIL